MFARLTAFVDRYFWLTVLLSLPAASPLLRPNYHWGAHDARHAVYFLYEFDKVIRDGIWYPRWAPDFAFGQGYPFFNIYGPLSSYAGELFLLLGFSFTDSVKIVFGLSLILSGATMYLFVRHILGVPAGLIAGLSYVYTPYHLLDVYVRAALAESFSFIFVPLVFWGVYQATTAPRLYVIILGSMSYAALLLSNPLIALLFSPFLGLYVLAVLSTKGLNIGLLWRGIPPAAVIILGLGLSSIFFLPLVTERQFINVGQWVDGGGRFVFSAFFVEFFQLFSPDWGFGIAVEGPQDQMSHQLGLVPVILFIHSFWAMPHVQQPSTRLLLRFLQGLVIVVTFLMLPISLPLWNILPLVELAQFPWRLLVVVAPGLAILAGTVVVELPPKDQAAPLITILPLTLLIILASFPYVQAQLREPQPTEGPVSLISLFRFQQSANEMTGVTTWVEEIPTWSNMAEHAARGGEEIDTRVLVNERSNADGNPLLGVHSFESDSVHEFVWVFAADDKQAVTFQIAYHPGWKATIYEDTDPGDDSRFPFGRIGQPLAQPEITTTSPEGWIVVPVPAGTHFVEIRFSDTPVRRLGTQISLVTSVLMIIGLLGEGVWLWLRGRQTV